MGYHLIEYSNWCSLFSGVEVPVLKIGAPSFIGVEVTVFKIEFPLPWFFGSFDPSIASDCCLRLGVPGYDSLGYFVAFQTSLFCTRLIYVALDFDLSCCLGDNIVALKRERELAACLVSVYHLIGSNLFVQTSQTMVAMMPLFTYILPCPMN